MENLLHLFVIIHEKSYTKLSTLLMYIHTLVVTVKMEEKAKEKKILAFNISKLGIVD